MSRWPDAWVPAKGQHVFELVTSGSRGWAQHYSGTGPAFIRVGNLDHHTITLDLQDIQRVTPPAGAEGERTRLKTNDLLVSITAEVGMVGLVPPDLGEAYINQHIALARPLPGVEPRYLAWYLASEADGKRSLREASRGGTKSGLGLDDIRQVEIPLAPLPEQQRIADKLDTVLARVHACRNRLTRVAPLLKRFRQSVLDAAMSGRLTADIQREVGASLEPLAKLGAISGGLTKNAKRDDLPLRRAYLRVANVHANELRLDDVSEIGLTEAEFAKTKLVAGDLLIVEGNGSIEQIGRVAMWSGEIADCCHQNHLIRWRAGSRVLPKFALCFLLSPEGRRQIESVASSTTGLHTLSVSKVGELRMPVPPLEEQTEIVRRVETLFAFADRLQTRLAQAETAVARLTPALLAKAFRGELVPQDPADEPATELLKRLAQSRPAAATKPRRRKAA